MRNKKNQQTMSLQVTDGLTVAVIPDSNHEFTMTTKEVAHGYGVHPDTIRSQKRHYLNEFIDGKHFVSGVQILHVASPGSTKGTLWTKRGIVRLGFFIKSERARLFRDWAEDLVINKVEKAARGRLFKTEQRALPKPRKHNRLTPERLLSIMADVARINDNELRMTITTKLMGGHLNDN